MIFVHRSKHTHAIGQNQSRVFWLPGNNESFECIIHIRGLVTADRAAVVDFKHKNTACNKILHHFHANTMAFHP